MSLIDQNADLYGRCKSTVGQVMETLVDCSVNPLVILTHNYRRNYGPERTGLRPILWDGVDFRP